MECYGGAVFPAIDSPCPSCYNGGTLRNAENLQLSGGQSQAPPPVVYPFPVVVT